MPRHHESKSAGQYENSNGQGSVRRAQRESYLDDGSAKNIEWNAQSGLRLDFAKRSSKNTPMEVTSKRPVTRKRTVVEVKAVQPRDPRFLPLSGKISATKFQEQYSFLTDLHASELTTLRGNLKRARQLLRSSPQELRAEREQEVGRLELAVKRAESAVNRDRRDKIEQEALNSVTKEEQEKRRHGKRGWWMKKSEKRLFLVRAKYDALEAAEGKGAVKKAIERKRRKISQIEKKSRPFANQSGSGKRPSREVEGDRFNKRRRME